MLDIDIEGSRCRECFKIIDVEEQNGGNPFLCIRCRNYIAHDNQHLSPETNNSYEQFCKYGEAKKYE